ncbi:MAG: hypothetical protein K1X68_02620 [Saprospiraceae bacterium]|nr:hypothetical protein [Saprospiraceae bacterium]
MLMTTSYKKWLEEKMTIPEAFHAAQKELREQVLDPYQWAVSNISKIYYILALFLTLSSALGLF